MSTLGERLKIIRRDKEISLSQLARATGLTKGFLSQMESGRSNPSLATLSKISQVLGVSTTALLLAPGEGGASGLVPTVPTTVAFGRKASWDGEVPEVQVVRAAGEGTHLLVDLPSNSELRASGAHASASILCVVLEGRAHVSQTDGSLQIAEGAATVWDGGKSYAVGAIGNSPVRLLLFVPQQLALPTLARLAGVDSTVGAAPTRNVSGVGSITPGPIERSTDGPLRLVAMRAQRLAERKRNS